MPNTGSSSPELPPTPEVGLPLWLLAELTYRCPLQCPYCSNPLDFAAQVCWGQSYAELLAEDEE